LLAILEAHHILHVSRVRVNSLLFVKIVSHDAHEKRRDPPIWSKNMATHCFRPSFLVRKLRHTTFSRCCFTFLSHTLSQALRGESPSINHRSHGAALRFVPFLEQSNNISWRFQRPLHCWDCGFESHRGHGCLSLVSGVCCAGRGLCVGLITLPEDPYRVWCV
jgi:hypothetical protein